MENTIIILVLLVVVVLAVLRTVKRFGSGGCCSGGSKTIRAKKKLTEPQLGEKTLLIEGMHCENCEIRVEDALNRVDGVAARASHKKQHAIVAYSAEVSDERLKETVENAGYQVLEIR